MTTSAAAVRPRSHDLVMQNFFSDILSMLEKARSYTTITVDSTGDVRIQIARCMQMDDITITRDIMTQMDETTRIRWMRVTLHAQPPRSTSF